MYNHCVVYPAALRATPKSREPVRTAMVRITVFEYHSHGTGPRLFSGPESSSNDESSPVEESTAEDESRSIGILGLVILFVGLLSAAAIYRWKMRDANEDSFEVESVEVTEYED